MSFDEVTIVGRLRAMSPMTEFWADQRIMKEAADTIEALQAALEWYGENARLCRLIHDEGDKGRNALADDGGKRARAALTQAGEKP
jgi:hypothetical protein